MITEQMNKQFTAYFKGLQPIAKREQFRKNGTKEINLANLFTFTDDHINQKSVHVTSTES